MSSGRHSVKTRGIDPMPRAEFGTEEPHGESDIDERSLGVLRIAEHFCV
jgi:hypothetical protein